MTGRDDAIRTAKPVERVPPRRARQMTAEEEWQVRHRITKERVCDRLECAELRIDASCSSRWSMHATIAALSSSSIVCLSRRPRRALRTRPSRFCVLQFNNSALPAASFSGNVPTTPSRLFARMRHVTRERSSVAAIMASNGSFRRSRSWKLRSLRGRVVSRVTALIYRVATRGRVGMTTVDGRSTVAAWLL